jgi:hypothetical protein
MTLKYIGRYESVRININIFINFRKGTYMYKKREKVIIACLDAPAPLFLFASPALGNSREE